MLIVAEREITPLGFLSQGSWNQHRAGAVVLNTSPVSCERHPTALFPLAPIPFLSHPSIGSPEGLSGACAAPDAAMKHFTPYLRTSRSVSVKRQQNPAKWIRLSRQHFPWKTGQQERSYHTRRLHSLKWSSVITFTHKKQSAEHLQMDFSCSPGLFTMVSTHLVGTTSHGRCFPLDSDIFSFPFFSYPTKLATDTTAPWRGAGRATQSVTPLDIPAKFLSDRLQGC